MYFLSLKNFDINRGLITDNQGKFPLLTSDKGVFEPSNSDVDTPYAFFDHLEVDGQVYYISEANILKVYYNGHHDSKKITVNYAYLIDNEKTSDILKDFFDGYRAGADQLYKELGQSFFSLGLEHRKEILHCFITYAKQMLYFEGFAIPELMYSLGYIQATLVQAVKEYRNIENLKEPPLALPEIILKPTFHLIPDAMPEEAAKASLVASVPPGSEDTIVSDTAPDLPNVLNNKLTLSCQEEEIAPLWFILADHNFCSANGLPQVFESKEDVLKLLGSIFLFPRSEAHLVIPGDDNYYQLAPSYQQLLCVLMHATYKINQRYDRLTLKPFCELLKRAFSPFETIGEVQDISSNITKKAELVTPLIAKSDGEYARGTCAILEKLGIYKLKS